MITVEHVTKFFGPVLAVDNVSFEVAKGEIVGFLGPNGAGKTTTMRILTSFLPATSGIATVAGFDVMNESLDVRRNIGYLPESVPLYPEMRVEEYLHYRARLKGVDRGNRQSRIESCLESCRIREVRRRLIGTLSKGYRQRVGLADTLIHEPAILILDEPTAGLDPVQIRETLATIKSLAHKHTILLSTHILPEVEAVCERVIIINAGRVGMDKTMAELATAQIIIQAEVRGSEEAVGRILRGIDGVTEVQVKPLGDGAVRCEIFPQDNQDLREAVFDALVAGHCKLRKLDIRRRNLDDHFMEVVVRGGAQDLN